MLDTAAEPANRHSVFISYSNKHPHETAQLAEVINAQYGPDTAWFDVQIEARGPYTPQISDKLHNSRVVVVIWNEEAARSDWVLSEVGRAYQAGKIVHVRPRRVPYSVIPQPYDIHHIAELEDQDAILQAVANVMAGRPLPTRVPQHELFWRQHGWRIVSAKRQALPADVQDISPTDLLKAQHAVVGYQDATGLHAELVRWSVSDASVRRRAGMLVHGAGGMGKTRLLIEVAATLRQAHGWMAGFVERPGANSPEATHQSWRLALEQLILHGQEPGLLLVIDYAAGRHDELVQIAQWIESRTEGNEGRPIRLVLLARGVGEWWDTLKHQHGELQRLFRHRPNHPAEREMPAFAQASDQQALFDASVQAFRPTLAAHGVEFPPEATAPAASVLQSMGRPLAVQMAALVWLSSHGAPEIEFTLPGLLDRVLGLEEAHWQKLLGALSDTAWKGLRRAVSQITLVQGLPDTAAVVGLLMHDHHYARTAPAAVDELVGQLTRLYGRDHDGGVLPLEPDLVGEHQVAGHVDTDMLDGSLAWIALHPQASDQTTYHRALLTVLQRGSRQPQHGLRLSQKAQTALQHLIHHHLSTLAPAVVAVSIDAPEKLPELVTQALPGLNTASLTALEQALPKQTVSLMELSLAVAQQRLEHLKQVLASTAQPEAHQLALLATRIGTVGNKLSALGRREHALVAAEEALTIWRSLAQDRPDAFLPNLAASLNNLGAMLSDLGRRAHALAAAEEALTIRRSLAEGRPNIFLPDLASSLNNLGLMLSALGKHKHALASTEEAFKIYRSLAEGRPDIFLPNLASSLNNLGLILSALGRHKQALASTEEAVTIYRSLAQDRPDAFRPDLAMSLNNLGKMLSALDRHEHAFSSTEEAATIYRALAQDRPDAFLPDLARSLNNLGTMLWNLNRQEHSLASAEEAITVYRALAQDRPDAFRPDLATSFGTYSQILAAQDRHVEAASATAEGLRALLPMLARYPQAFQSLAMTLTSDHTQHCQSAQTELDRALLDQVIKALGLVDHEPA